ncbi:MAG: generic methyltransferase [Phycisphaerae bacterium]|nr:MAG: generic methyltransferase [Phycisphaerae bacterium]
MTTNPTAEPLKLHIGGEAPKEGWKILNVQALPHVDYLGSATDLSVIPDGSCSHVYGSHIYEHLAYSGELGVALKEAYRVLRPGGVIMVAVPDLEVLCRLFLRPELDLEQRFFVMRMIYGGQTNAWDYHKVGFNAEILGAFLYDTGFVDVMRVPSFGLFEDTSNTAFEGVPISLNVQASKPG